MSREMLRPEIVRPARTSDEKTSTTPPAATNERTIPATPSVRRYASSLGVDLTSVTGTGVGGRIRTADVRAAHRAQTTGWFDDDASSAATEPPRQVNGDDHGWFTGVDLAGRPVGDAFPIPERRGAIQR